MRVAIGSDHAGFEYKALIADYLTKTGRDVTLFGAPDTSSFDYPIAADEVARAVIDGTHDLGILVCGSGIGVCMRANRHPGIRAAQCFSVEMAELARRHNHANVLCLGERVQAYGGIEAIVEAFLTTQPDEAARHNHRVELIEAPITP